MKINRFLLIMSFAVFCSCLMARETGVYTWNDWYNERLRKSGELAPKDEGFFGSIVKGSAQAGTNFIGGIGSTMEELFPSDSDDPTPSVGKRLSDWRDETLRNNQQWNKSPNNNIGECLGHALGNMLVYFSWLIILLCIVAVVRSKRRIRKYKDEKVIADKVKENSKIQALEELQSGNVDQLTWANALIATQGDEEKARAKYLELRKCK